MEAVDILKPYPYAFTQINTTLGELVPSVSSYLITLFTLSFWTSKLALNTLPVLNESITTYIHRSLVVDVDLL